MVSRYLLYLSSCFAVVACHLTTNVFHICSIAIRRHCLAHHCSLSCPLSIAAYSLSLFRFLLNLGSGDLQELAIYRFRRFSLSFINISTHSAAFYVGYFRIFMEKIFEAKQISSFNRLITLYCLLIFTLENYEF